MTYGRYCFVLTNELGTASETIHFMIYLLPGVRNNASLTNLGTFIKLFYKLFNEINTSMRINMSNIVTRWIASMVVLLCPIWAAQVRGPMKDVTSDSKFIVYYGDDYYSTTSGDPSTWVLNENVMNNLIEFDVVVINPGQPHCTPQVVQHLKTNGVDYVLGYISVGEDFIDDAIEAPLDGGTGMLMYDASSGKLVPTPGNSLQSFYVDVDSQEVTYDSNGKATKVLTTSRLIPDGIPDYNPTFLGYMVNPDVNWRTVLETMRIGGSGITGRSLTAGLQQIAEDRDPANMSDRTTNFGCDGFFLDTLDTAGPYDGAGWYPWTVDEMRDTVKYISDTYQDKTVFANRGAFFFSAGLQSPVTNEYSIDFTIRPYINAFLFESFLYDSDPEKDLMTGISEYYLQNRYNVVPKVFAEASRVDGFTMFSLEYQSGRAGIDSTAFDIDIRQFGFTAYLCQDRHLNTTDTIFADRLPDSQNDKRPPTWDTTGNELYNITSASSRVGVQAVVEGIDPAQAVVQWDVAIDQSSEISYDIVVKDLIGGAITTHTAVAFETNPQWLHDPTSHSANQFLISGLTTGTSYNIKVLASDGFGNINTEDAGSTYSVSSVAISNKVADGAITVDGMLSDWAALDSYPPDPNDIVGVSNSSHVLGAGNQANWRQVQVAHTTDTDTIYFAYTNESPIFISWGFQVFIDTDDDANTGFQGSFGGISAFPIGADYLIEGVNVFQYNGAGASWDWVTSVGSEGYQVGRSWAGNTGEIFFPLHWIGKSSTSGGKINFVLFGNNEYYVPESEEVDWYPNNAVNGASFSYSFE